MLKRFLLSGLLLAGLSVIGHSKGPEQTVSAYNYAKGLDSFHSSLSLPDGFVQDSNNVYFDRAAPVEKRQGYTVAFSTKSYSFQGTWSYTDPNNTSWIIARSSDEIVASNLSGSVVKIATTSANDLVSEVNAFGNAYFVDPTQGVYFWNGTATTYVPSSPKGSLITQFHGRIWVTGQAVPNGNLLNGSKYLDGTTWIAGLNPNDPVQFTVGLQDAFDNISALYPFIDTLYITKHYSISALYGFDQTNFQISFITGECGCIDAQSIQTFNHGLYFVSLRGVESFNGYGCTRVSDPIKNKVDVAIQSQGGFNTQSWVQQSETDFNAGTYGSSTTYSTSGIGVAISTNDVNIPDNSFENGTWTTGTVFNTHSGTVNGTHCTLSPEDGSFQALATSADGNFFQVTITVVDATNATVYATFTENWASNTCSQQNHFFSGFTASPKTVVKVAMTNSSSGATVNSSTFSWSGNALSWFERSDTTSGGAKVLTIDNFTNGRNTLSTGTYISQSHSISGANSFGNFTVNQALNGGTGSYSICTSANSNMSPQICTAQTPNSQIIGSTNTFIDVVATFTTPSPTISPILQTFTIQWFTGSRTPSMASTVWDNRYWLSISTVSSDTGNDAILVDSQNNVWTAFDIHAGGLTQYKNNLYHSDSTATGNIYLDGQGYNDNGNPINAYIKTKDYNEGDLTQDSFIDSIWPTMDNLGNYNVSTSYFVDRYSSAYPLGVMNQTEFQATASVKLPFPIDSAHQDFGKTVSYLFSATDLGEPWRFYGFREILHARPTQ